MAKREEILNDPSTHFLVGEVLALADRHDIVDAIYDIELAAEVLRTEARERFEIPAISENLAAIPVPRITEIQLL